MSNIIQGKKDPQEQAPSYGYQPGRGFHSVRRWKITNPADIPGLLNQLIAAGYAYEVTPEADGAITLVEARFGSDPLGQGDPTTTILSEIWERDALVTEKDILESDLAAVAQISQSDKELIRNSINSPPKDASPALSGASVAVYLLMLSGVKHVRVSSPVVRRTRITANAYTVKASDANMGRILSTASMTTLEGAPTTVLFSLPTFTSARTDIDLRYGWFKKPAKVTQQGDGRWQIVQEYEYDNWAAFLYGAPI